MLKILMLSSTRVYGKFNVSVSCILHCTIHIALLTLQISIHYQRIEDVYSGRQASVLELALMLHHIH